MGTIHLLNKLGYKIYQIPLQFKDRKEGVSKIPKIEIFRTLKFIFDQNQKALINYLKS